MRAYTHNTDTHVHVFDTLGEMLDTANMRPHAAQDAGIVDRVRDRAKGDAWTYGTLQNADTFTRTMREGWHDATARIDQIAASISASVATPLDVRRKMRRGPSGDELDIHAVLAGNLDRAWSARRRTVARAPAPIRILCNVVYNSGSDTDDFFWRGACALALVRALRKKGYRTAISGVGLLVRPWANSRRGDYLARFDALRYGEAIDSARLAAILCTSATLRHTMFRTVLTCPRQVSSGFGCAPSDAQLSEAVVEYGAFPMLAEERLVIPDVSNARDANAWLAKVSAQFA